MPLHLVKVPLRADQMASIAKRRQIRLRALDDGYLAHCVLTELWQDDAPSPFVLRGRGRSIDVWGYSRKDAPELIAHANDFGDPSLLFAVNDVNAISSKPMPTFATGRRIGFLTRVCPVVRLARPFNEYRSGAEVDAFLARVLASDAGATLTREDVYCNWFLTRMKDVFACGAIVNRVRVAGMARKRIVRRTQGSNREARMLERPDVHIEGDLTIEDGDAFKQFLVRGVGRHRAFGYGALIVVPPGTSHDHD